VSLFKHMAQMPWTNHTSITKFILLGFGNLNEVQILLFVVFLVIYIVTLAGNLLIVALVVADQHLHTPMYFFLGNLSFLETCYTSVSVPRLLSGLLVEDRTISFRDCITQLFFLSALACIECFLLAVMAYDRYLAICNPLNYNVMMNLRVLGIWASGFLISLPHTLSLLRLSFCGPNIINHFFCELPPLLQLSCSDTGYNQTLALVTDVFLGIGCFLLTLLSYVYIVSSVLKIQSAAGKRKAFSTCSSHVMVVTLFYSTVIYTYVRPPSAYLDRDKAVAALYTMVTPLVNPLIYSLRNKEVKEAFKKLMGGNRG
uniref:Olfactory receptor n=1 Tax=Chrysemys picta bellii TaxID=8478 RepID=A0A8C3FVP6_CHRPI